jgi:hypothetical protein
MAKKRKEGKQGGGVGRPLGPENCKLFFWTLIKNRRQKNMPRVTKKVEKSREYIVPATKIQKTKTKNQKLVGKSKGHM